MNSQINCFIDYICFHCVSTELFKFICKCTHMQKWIKTINITLKCLGYNLVYIFDLSIEGLNVIYFLFYYRSQKTPKPITEINHFCKNVESCLTRCFLLHYLYDSESLFHSYHMHTHNQNNYRWIFVCPVGNM